MAVKYMTPVILLSDGGLGNATEPWRIPDLATLPDLGAHFRTDPQGFQPYARDEHLARAWVRPGTPGLEHRIGGLEKDWLTGEISSDGRNHQRMVDVRAAKVAGIAADFAPLRVTGPDEGDVLVVGWGSTYGPIVMARQRAALAGHSVAHLHLRHINPLPTDLGEVMARYTKVLVPEMNLGQLARLLRDHFLVDVVQLNKLEGRPFKVSEIYERILELC
jgi:2-oxoglutarate ferredoxin oxidoreductase subunit alpha